MAAQRGAGVFVLVKTSNPGGGMFQDLVAEGLPIYDHVARFVESLAENGRGDIGLRRRSGRWSGRRIREQLAELRAIMPHAWLLVPGFGSQGGTAGDVAGAFDAEGTGRDRQQFAWDHLRPRARPYAERFGARRWQEAVEAATRDMIEQLRAETPAGKLAGR